MSFRLTALFLTIGVLAVNSAQAGSVEDRFLSLIFKDEHVGRLKEDLITNAIERNPNFSQFKSELHKWADSVFVLDSIKHQLSSYFDTTLSEKDMQAVISFYESESGKKFLASNSGLSSYMQKIMHHRFSSSIASLHEMVARAKRNTLEDIKTPTFEGSKVEDPAGKYRFKFKKSKWQLLERNLTRAADFSFQHSNGKIMGIILSEGRSIDSETLKEAAKQNLQRGSDKMQVLSEKDITIDSNKGYFLEMEAKMASQDLTYFGYVVGGANGGVQVLCWTYSNKAKEYRPEAMDFLNGLQSFIN